MPSRDAPRRNPSAIHLPASNSCPPGPLSVQDASQGVPVPTATTGQLYLSASQVLLVHGRLPTDSSSQPGTTQEPVPGEVDPSPDETHAFRLQPLPLHERAGSTPERDAAARAHDALPGHAGGGPTAEGAQRPAHRPRPARDAQEERDLAVGGHPAPGDPPDSGVDAREKTVRHRGGG